ncbi:MAG: HpcH/HpaI aldolase/citrate lyase family protein [Mangrovibacterium sp.]
MKKELLNKLKDGSTVYGTCITSMAPLWSKVARDAALDFVFLDTEHVPLERMEVAVLCQLYSSMGIAPIVRIPSPDPFRACQIVDAGAEGIVAPYIENTRQVKEMVGAIKYRPLKGEKLQKVLENPDRIEPELQAYLNHYNAGNLCIINVESTPAVEKLDELLSIPGLNGVFIGPHDLSVSMGLPEMYDHPEFEETVRRIIQTCRAKNIAVGIHFSESPQRQVKWLSEGINMVIHSSDLAIFSRGLARDIRQIKQSQGDVYLASSEDIVI